VNVFWLLLMLATCLLAPTAAFCFTSGGSSMPEAAALVHRFVLGACSATGGALFARLGAMPLLERLLILIAAVLLVAALALLTGHDIGRNAVGPKPQVSAAGAGRFWWQ
jgi:hypothetical protein